MLFAIKTLKKSSAFSGLPDTTCWHFFIYFISLSSHLSGFFLRCITTNTNKRSKGCQVQLCIWCGEEELHPLSFLLVDKPSVNANLSFGLEVSQLGPQKRHPAPNAYKQND
jgi:hypothetical protein